MREKCTRPDRGYCKGDARLAVPGFSHSRESFCTSPAKALGRIVWRSVAIISITDSYHKIKTSRNPTPVALVSPTPLCPPFAPTPPPHPHPLMSGQSVARHSRLVADGRRTGPLRRPGHMSAVRTPPGGPVREKPPPFLSVP